MGYDQPVQAESGDALVARGGANRDASALYEEVLDHLDSSNKPVLSVFSNDQDANETIDEWEYRICRTAGFPHNKVQWATLGSLRAIGLSVVWEVGDGEAPNHHHVYFQLPVTESQLRAFVECFSEPRLNPVPKEERGK